MTRERKQRLRRRPIADKTTFFPLNVVSVQITPCLHAKVDTHYRLGVDSAYAVNSKYGRFVQSSRTLIQLAFRAQ